MGKRGDVPTLRELLEAKHRELLRGAVAIERALEVLDSEISADIAPRGCAMRVAGVDCSPSTFRRICLHCGALFQRCTRHGGESARNGLEAELARHLFEVHGADDRAM